MSQYSFFIALRSTCDHEQTTRTMGEPHPLPKEECFRFVKARSGAQQAEGATLIVDTLHFVSNSFEFCLVPGPEADMTTNSHSRGCEPKAIGARSKRTSNC